MVDVDINELFKARYMSLQCPPSSSQAKEFCEGIITDIKASEVRIRSRKPRDDAAFVRCASLIIADLILGSARGGGGWSYHPMSRSYFSELSFGYVAFKSIIDEMQKLGLVSVSKGRNAADANFTDKVSFRPSLATRIKPTTKMIEKLIGCGISVEAAHKHFPQQLPSNVIEVRGASKRFKGQKIKGRRLKAVKNDAYLQIEEEIKSLNSFLSSFQIEGGAFSGYRRLFNQADHPDFNYNKGGRIYCSGSHSYQELKKQSRQNLKIDGSEIVEIDVNASYLTILHGIKGCELPDGDDIYDIEGIDRRVVKSWIKSTMGHQDFHKRWTPEIKKDLSNEGIRLAKHQTYGFFKAPILEKFPCLAGWGEEDIGWADLMYLESKAIIGTMMEMMLLHASPCLSVHDSIIVRKSDSILASKILIENYQLHCGVIPRLHQQPTPSAVL